MRNKLIRQNGISLVELMVGIAISLILLAGVLTLTLRVSTGGAATVKSARLNQELRDSMRYMSRELQRAGYVNVFEALDFKADGIDPEGDGVLTADIDNPGTHDDKFPAGSPGGDGFFNMLDFSASALPVMDLFGAVTLHNLDDSACDTDCPCILYSYDLDGNGLQGVGSGTAGTNQDNGESELFGIRHDAANGEIDILTDGAHSCTDGGSTWTAITDDGINVTNLDFNLVYSDVSTAGGDSTVYIITGGTASTDDDTGCAVNVSGAYPTESDTICLKRRKVEVEIEGELNAEPDVRAELSNEIKIKNDFLHSQ